MIKNASGVNKVISTRKLNHIITVKNFQKQEINEALAHSYSRIRTKNQKELSNQFEKLRLSN